MKPLVSILIPAYNAAQWIVPTITSALEQTWPNIEIIIVDDGSTDETPNILRRYNEKRVKIVSQHNAGASAARNAAHALSQGDYIQWLDADDLLHPEKIALQLAQAKATSSPSTLLSGEWGKFYFRPRKAVFRKTELWRDHSKASWLHTKLLSGAFMQTATWLVPRDIAESAGQWNTALLGDDDGEYFCRVLLASGGTKFVEGSKVYYRETDSTRLSHVGRSERKIAAHLHSMSLHIQYLLSVESRDVALDAIQSYIRRYHHYFYETNPELWADFRRLASAYDLELRVPQVRRKYQLVQKLFGWTTANRVQIWMPAVANTFRRETDRLLLNISRHPKERI